MNLWVSRNLFCSLPSLSLPTELLVQAIKSKSPEIWIQTVMPRWAGKARGDEWNVTQRKVWNLSLSKQSLTAVSADLNPSSYFRGKDNSPANIWQPVSLMITSYNPFPGGHYSCVLAILLHTIKCQTMFTICAIDRDTFMFPSMFLNMKKWNTDLKQEIWVIVQFKLCSLLQFFFAALSLYFSRRGIN